MSSLREPFSNVGALYRGTEKQKGDKHLGTGPVILSSEEKRQMIEDIARFCSQSDRQQGVWLNLRRILRQLNEKGAGISPPEGEKWTKELMCKELARYLGLEPEHVELAATPPPPCTSSEAGREVAIIRNPHSDIHRCYICNMHCEDHETFWQVRTPYCALSGHAVDPHHYVYCSACLRANRCLGCEKDNARGEVLMGIDNSNMIVGLQMASGFMTPCGDIVDDRWRVNFIEFFNYVLEGRTPAHGSVIVGSTTGEQSVDSLWSALLSYIESRGWQHRVKLIAVPRKIRSVEKEVDATLMMALHDTLTLMSPITGTLRLFTSDRDFVPLVSSFVSSRWHVQMLAWQGEVRTKPGTTMMYDKFKDNALVKFVDIPRGAPVAFRMGYQRLEPRMYRYNKPKIAALIKQSTQVTDKDVQEAMNMMSAHLTNVARMPFVYTMFYGVVLFYISPCAEDHIRRNCRPPEKGESVIRSYYESALEYLRRVMVDPLAGPQLLGPPDVQAWESLPMKPGIFESHEQAWMLLRYAMTSVAIQLPTKPPTYVQRY